MTRSTGFSTGKPVASLVRSRTSVMWRPCASSWVHPVRSSATAFRNRTRPSTSVATTASPMLASVVRNHSRSFFTAELARASSAVRASTRASSSALALCKAASASSLAAISRSSSRGLRMARSCGVTGTSASTVAQETTAVTSLTRPASR